MTCKRTRSRSSLRSLPVLLVLGIGLSTFLPGCGGGGGGGVSTSGIDGGSGGDGFHLESVSFGRPILDGRCRLRDVVNPFTLVKIDPLTGEVREGGIRPLFPGDPLDRLVPIVGPETQAHGRDDACPLPRDAGLVLRFSAAVDPASLGADEQGMLGPESPLRIEDPRGGTVPLQALVRGDRVLVTPVTEARTGFPSLPEAPNDETGNPAPEAAFLLVIGDTLGETPPLRARGGAPLAPRKDLFASALEPVRLLPGEPGAWEVEGTDRTLEGTLPAGAGPRIVREVRDEGTAGPGSGPSVVVDPTKQFVMAANNGMGEWAGGLVTVRPGAPDEEKAWVLYNTDTALYVAGAFAKPPLPGKDAYLVQRAELFEPIPGLDPATSVDPQHHPKDPFDPEDRKNWELYNFACFEEWNESTGTWDPVAYEPGPNGENPVDPKWRISFRFSEPMAVETFRPFETFYVCDGTLDPGNPGFGSMKIGRITAREGRRVVSFEPVLEDRTGAAGGDRLLGFGGKPKTLRLVLRVIPSKDRLDRFYAGLGPPGTWPPQVVEDLDDTGVLGIASAGGIPLGLPAQLFDPASPWYILERESPGRGAFPPAVDLKYTFHTQRTKDPEYGVWAHRFMGMPEIGSGGPPPVVGIEYHDHPGKLYGPRLADVGLRARGFLTGHAVEFIQHVFDDYNPPGPGSPFYPDPITKYPIGVGTPVTATYGCRFQHIYRNGEVSPDVPAYQGSVLDLVGLAWAPIGGCVTKGLIEKMSIALSYSEIVPDTTQSSGIPNSPGSGLKQNFDANYTGYEPQVVVGRDLPGGPDEGVPYLLDPVNLFAPKNAGPQFHYYLPWPAFRNPGRFPGFPYDSLHSLLVEYRMDPSTLPLPTSNGFSFHTGIIGSMLPRFRVFARGDDAYFGPVHAATYPENYPNAWGPLSPPGSYGDNARYFMIFDFVKRTSTIDSFYLGGSQPGGKAMDFLTPLVDSWCGKVPEGAKLHVTFQAALDPNDPNSPVSPWMEVEDVERSTHVLYPDYDFLRFRAVFTADVEHLVVPAIDTVVIPYVFR